MVEITPVVVVEPAQVIQVAAQVAETVDPE
jgi:hypothetical protein